MENQVNVVSQEFQGTRIVPADQPTRLSPGQKPNCWTFLTIILVILLLLIAGIVAINFDKITNNTLYQQSTSVKDNVETTTSSLKQDIPTPTSEENLITTPEQNFKKYVNEKFGYGFSYQNSFAMLECPDLSCASIHEITLRVDALPDHMLSQPDLKESLLSIDLYCNSGGPFGSTECQNTKVEDFTNVLGFKGFKVYRSKVVIGSRGAASAVIPHDIAYVFPLQRVVEGQGLWEYSGILLAVDTTTDSNLEYLEEIADSFFSF